MMSAAVFAAQAFGTSVEPLADASAFTPAPLSHASGAVRKAPSVPAGQWNELGVGRWSDDLFSFYQIVAPGDSWDVLVEQSAASPAWYRLLPYGPDSNVAKMLEDDDSRNYVYINTTDPEKVYIPDFKAYGKWLFSQHVDENGWWDETEYGTLKDGIITFPANCFGVRIPESGKPWDRVNTSGKTRLVLPGYSAADFTLKMECPFCADEEGHVRIRFTVGEDIAVVKYALLQGEYFAEGNENAIIAQGSDLKGNVLRATPKTNAMFTLVAVGLGHDESVVAANQCSFFGPGNLDPDTWRPAGEASMVESFFCPIYSNLTAEQLVVPYEESVEHPGRIRLVDPYSVHGFNPALAHSHPHYLYIDAQASSAVYVEPSAIGVDFGGGESALWSWAGRYVEYGKASDAFNEGLFGSRSGNVITMPDNALLVAEKNYAGGSFGTTGKDFRISLRPSTLGIEGVDASDETAEARYYRLDGTELPEAPTAPGLYIRKSPSKAEKFIVR